MDKTKEYKKYPIYSFSARWSQEGESEYPGWKEGLPEGRIWNGTGFSRMFKEEKTQEELDQIAKDWWEKMLAEKNKEESKHPIKNPELKELKVKFKEYDSWILTWFCHETFDTGQTPAEALESFEEYVSRTEAKNKKIERSCPESEHYNQGLKTLMGADDRWRWHGEKEGDPAPCLCKHCKKQGMIRIGH
jgi:hypothetical protein